MHAFFLALFVAVAGGSDGGIPDSGLPSRPAALPDAGVSLAFGKAADGTPMVLPDGDANPAYYNPPKAYRSPEGFQGAHWGMSKAEVKKAFTRLIIDHTNIGARTKVAAFDAQASFGFTENRLAVVLVDVVAKGPEAADFHDAFATIARGLTAKYGAPAIDRDQWISDLFKDDFGTALALGHVVPNMRWDTGEMYVTLSTDVGETHRLVTLRYESRRLSDAWEREEEKADAKSRSEESDGL